MTRETVLSGMRPTGRLHQGNFWGALSNWVRLTADYDCYFCVVDWHMLTTGYENTGSLQQNIQEMVLDWLAAGLDPARCVIFKQSAVPEHAELALLLGMVTPLSWLENCPTWKEQLQELAKTKHSALLQGASAQGSVVVESEQAAASLRTFGLLGYPVLQAADILLYGGAKIPVGKDQLPHLEISREIVRRFNGVYGDVFVEPQPLLTATPRVPGLDGRKMSKSYGNGLDLFESEKDLKIKVMSMYTDPTRLRATDPGHPLPCPENEPGCSAFAFHQLYGEKEFVSRRETECREGRIGCVACKKDLLSAMEPRYAEFRRAREKFSAEEGLVSRILEEGSRKARAKAQATMERVRRAMRLA